MNRYEEYGPEYAKLATSREKATMIIMVSLRCLSFLNQAKQATGIVRDRTDAFKSIRKQTVDKEFLEISRLEKRLTRLTQLLASLPPDQIHPSATKLWSLAWQNDRRKEIEQTIVSWQDDASVSRCPFCQQEFSGYTFRRHHCRTCGRIVCGDPSTGCSSEVGLSISPGESRDDLHL